MRREPRENGAMPTSRRSRRRPYSEEPRPLDLDRATAGRSSEERRGEEWVVQRIREGTKEYVCPGCRQTIAVGTDHVVAWRADGIMGAAAALADRRHWHQGCWRRAR